MMNDETAYAKLVEDYADLQVLYENNLEHSSALENELVTQNKRMQELQNKMKKYLSPQLFQTLLGALGEVSSKTHQRKKLAIYFSDIVGFSDLTDSLEPELLSDILNSYLTRMAEIAIEFGGTIDKFIGDAILVFFGDPEFIDDRTHVQRCTGMALAMREELFRLRELWKQKGINRTLQVRAGINLGYCTVGNFGSENRLDYTVIGGQVNVASRLQAAAPPDAIYISGAAQSLVADLFQTRIVGPLNLKGIHAPVDTFELLGESVQSNPAHEKFLAFEGSSIRLEGVEIDLATVGDDEIESLRKALGLALVNISNFRR